MRSRTFLLIRSGGVVGVFRLITQTDRLTESDLVSYVVSVTRHVASRDINV